MLNTPGRNAKEETQSKCVSKKDERIKCGTQGFIDAGKPLRLQQSHSYESIYLSANRIKLYIHTLQV